MRALLSGLLLMSKLTHVLCNVVLSVGDNSLYVLQVVFWAH
jgi:hypothetical protein